MQGKRTKQNSRIFGFDLQWVDSTGFVSGGTRGTVVVPLIRVVGWQGPCGPDFDRVMR